MAKTSETPQQTATPGWPGPGLAALIYLGLAVVYFLPAFLPWNHIYGSDYLAAGFFSHEFISERLSAGALPKWMPYIYGGVPWWANPGSTWYPVRFIADLLFEPHRIFATIYVVQFAIAGFGTYLLSRELGARKWVALVAGLAFQFTGLTMSAVLGGHEGRIIVATFTPLFFFFLHRGVRTGAFAWFAGAALTLGSSLLSFQIQSNYYLLLAGAAWGVFAIISTGVRGWRPVSGRVALGLGAVAVGFLMAAINFLPFLDYVDASPRGGPGRGYEYATSWSMPPSEITGLALPEQAGLLENYQGENPFKLHTEYVGAVVLLLVALGAWYNRRDRYWWFFAAMAVVALTFSFGGHTPLYRLYYELLPGTARFRAPSISFFLVSVALAMMAALTLERLARRRDGPEPPDAASRGTDLLAWILGGASGLALIVLLVSAGGDDAHGRALAQGAFRLALVTWLASVALWTWLRRGLDSRLVMAALALLVVADLWIVDRRFFDTVDHPDTMFAADDVVAFLQEQPGPFRVWVLPPEILRQQAWGGGFKNYLVRFDIPQAGGEHGNQLQRYNEYLGAGENVYVDWHNFLADLQLLIQSPGPAGAPRSPAFLAAANIRYIISTVQLPGLREVFRGRRGLVYEVPAALPHAYLVGDAVIADAPDGALDVLAAPGFDPATTAVLYESPSAPLPGGPAEGEVRVEEHAPDEVRLVARTERPALLVLADNMYEGWQATIDDDPVPILLANHTFRAVELPAGTHEVVFRFRPADFYTGGLISLVSVLAMLGIAGAAAWRERRRHRGERPTA